MLYCFTLQLYLTCVSRHTSVGITGPWEANLPYYSQKCTHRVLGHAQPVSHPQKKLYSWTLNCKRFGCSSYAWERGITAFFFLSEWYDVLAIKMWYKPPSMGYVSLESAAVMLRIFTIYCEQFTVVFPNLHFDGDFLQGTKRACLRPPTVDDSCLPRSLLV